MFVCFACAQILYDAAKGSDKNCHFCRTILYVKEIMYQQNAILFQIVYLTYMSCWFSAAARFRISFVI